MSPERAALYMALVHYPVLNRRGEIIASAITNLDLHDLGRTACTYDIPVCYIVTPLADQQALAREIVRHWCEGAGKEIHPDRAAALERLRIVGSLADACRDVEQTCGRTPSLWATSASEHEGALRICEARRLLTEGAEPALLLLGTGWGLAASLRAEIDAVLEPIRGLKGYNHLSVRCAAAILLDRLLAPRC